MFGLFAFVFVLFCSLAHYDLGLSSPPCLSLQNAGITESMPPCLAGVFLLFAVYQLLSGL